MNRIAQSYERIPIPGRTSEAQKGSLGQFHNPLGSLLDPDLNHASCLRRRVKSNRSLVGIGTYLETGRGRREDYHKLVSRTELARLVEGSKSASHFTYRQISGQR